MAEPTTAGTADLAGGLAGCDRAVGRHAVLQRDDVLALDTTLSNPGYDGPVRGLDAFGSISLPGVGRDRLRGLAPATACASVRGTRGWWLPLVNLLGCVLFGISAVAGYVVPASS